MRPFQFLAGLFLVLACCSMAKAQQVQAAPGKFDFYLLNLSWAPEFCHNVQVLPQSNTQAHNQSRRTGRHQRRALDTTAECGTPHGFVLHGLWPQNFNGTYPANCSNRPGPTDYTSYLDLTPSLTLLQHEWSKHGTCTTLAPDDFFQTARKAFNTVNTPQQFTTATQQITLKPDDILSQFYSANPGFPQGSLILSCGRNYLTAIEACFDKTTLRPIACQGLTTCRANVVKVEPESSATAQAR